jgi:chromosome segregation ATPase
MIHMGSSSAGHIAARTLAMMSMALLCFADARAQVSRAPSQGANTQLMLQIQQLGSEKTRLEGENAKLKQDLATAQKALDSFKGGRKALEQKARSAAAEIDREKARQDAAADQVKQTQAKLELLVAKFRETAETLRAAETDRAAAHQQIAARDKQLQQCSEHNAKLYQLNAELLAHIEHEGLFSRVAASEPFTRLKRIDNENLVDGYKLRAESERSDPPKSAQ